ncbi:MAG: GDP-mannose 4,6-dehydratase [Myxococcales bacterium]|nr:GDP-mannose 4,6-dehydratase [Myxococcales bacterium]
MKILLTGAAGFIGSHTLEALLERGDDVVAIDNFDPYYSPERKRRNVDEASAGARPGQLTFVAADVRDRAGMDELFLAHRPEAVVHLAAMAGVRASIAAPQLYLDVNLSGTLNLLEGARRSGCRGFVFASTSSVYGATRTIPFVETDPCDRPLAPYPATKRAAELLGHAYHHLYRLPFTALRFFTVYGPRGRPDMMAYKVLSNIFFGEEVPLYAGGQMHRDWTYVADIVRGIVAAVDRPLGYEVVNLGRGEPVLLADFVRRVEALTGKRAALRDAPMEDADIAYTFADTHKAARLLGYAPTVGTDEGIERFWQWYRAAVLGT